MNPGPGRRHRQTRRPSLGENHDGTASRYGTGPAAPPGGEGGGRAGGGARERGGWPVSTTDAGPPTVVGGRYTVGDLIGRGGAADVYRARDELLGRDAAIKMFGAGGGAGPAPH